MTVVCQVCGSAYEIAREGSSGTCGECRRLNGVSTFPSERERQWVETIPTLDELLAAVVALR